MKRSCILLALIFPPLCCALADGEEWRADLAADSVHNIYLRRGDATTLRAELYVRGREYLPSTAVAKYRTNLVDRTWLQAPATIASNTVSFAWTPFLAPGADVVPFVICVDGEVYRAPAMIYLRASPDAGSDEAHAVLDLDAYDITNAPWATPGDLADAIGSINFPEPNYSSSNAALVATIQAVAPAPGNYETVSNRAMSAVQTETDPTTSIDLTNPRLPEDAFPVSYYTRGTFFVAGPNDLHYYAYGNGAAMISDETHGLSICEFNTNGTFDCAWAQAENLRFAGVTPVENAWPRLIYPVYVRGEEVQPAVRDLDRIRRRLDGFDNFTDVFVPIIVSIGPLSTNYTDAAAVAATNYTDSAKTVAIAYASAVSNTLDAAIRAAEPGDYATVSNRAMSALQSYTETDPTVPAWAKSATKPAYTAAEVGALATEVDPVFTAWVLTNVPSGGGADMVAVSNAVSDLMVAAVAENPVEPTLEVLRMAVAELWESHDKLAGLEAYDDIAEAIDAMVSGPLTNYPPRTEVAQNLAGYVPTSRTVNNKALSANVTLSASDVGALPVSGYSAISPADIGSDPYIYVEFYGSTRILSYTGTGSLEVGGLYAPNGPPCHLVLSGFSSVSWPSYWYPIVDGTYDSSSANYYEVGSVNGQSYVRFLFSFQAP